MEDSREGPSLAGKGRVGGKEGFAGNNEAFQEEGPKGEKHVECAESSIRLAALGVRCWQC